MVIEMLLFYISVFISRKGLIFTVMCDEVSILWPLGAVFRPLSYKLFCNCKLKTVKFVIET